MDGSDRQRISRIEKFSANAVLPPVFGVNIGWIIALVFVALANGYGFTAIITAWLARLNAVAILFVCIAFAALIQGGAYIQIALGISSSVASIVQGMILFFVLGSEFFLQYKVSFRKRTPAAKEVA